MKKNLKSSIFYELYSRIRSTRFKIKLTALFLCIVTYQMHTRMCSQSNRLKFLMEMTSRSEMKEVPCNNNNTYTDRNTTTVVPFKSLNPILNTTRIETINTLTSKTDLP